MRICYCFGSGRWLCEGTDAGDIRNRARWNVKLLFIVRLGVLGETMVVCFSSLTGGWFMMEVVYLFSLASGCVT